MGIRDKRRNKRIVQKRSAGERPYDVIKNIFKSGHQLVTTTLRTHTKKPVHMLLLQPTTTKNPTKK
ncbi:MAG: hypothetical protein KKF16_06795 [Euryarchaeota archaeon]|nr:hypothetical protein [Euryarchaeota archaeon]